MTDELKGEDAKLTLIRVGKYKIDEFNFDKIPLTKRGKEEFVKERFAEIRRRNAHLVNVMPGMIEEPLRGMNEWIQVIGTMAIFNEIKRYMNSGGHNGIKNNKSKGRN